MSDEQNPAQPPDNSFKNGDPRFIDIYNPAERAFWAKALDTSEHALMNAVETVGTSAQKVREYLRKS